MEQLQIQINRLSKGFALSKKAGYSPAPSF